MDNIVKSLFGKKGNNGTDEAVPAEVVGGAAPEAAEYKTVGPIHVSEETFEETVLHSPLPVLVDFWAPWCGPCRMIAPIVEELAAKYAGRAVIAKVNTDENQEMAADLGIMGIPTLILYQNGEEVDRIVGFAPGHALEEKLQAVMG